MMESPQHLALPIDFTGGNMPFDLLIRNGPGRWLRIPLPYAAIPEGQARAAGYAVAISLISLGGDVISAQDYPSKAIRLFASGVGGGGDFTARLIAQGIAGPLGQPVTVENRTNVLAEEAVFR